MRCAARHRLVWIALAAALAAPVSSALAQELRGVVRDSASGLPVPSAVVTLLDSTRSIAARTITNERGQFRVVLLGNAVRRVRVVRLGFRPTSALLPEPVDGTIRVEIMLASISMQLAPVQIGAGSSCPRRGDRARALAVLEQARAGLLATVVARSDKPARMMRLRATRTMDGYSDRVIHQRVRIDSAGTVFGSFGAALNADNFIRSGFARDSSGSVQYFGPDAEVLLDDRFAAGYCFHLMDPARARPNQIGLGFRPGSRRDGRVDVDGALWIDTVARALVDIEYQYLGVDPRAEPFHPGGHIWFHGMPNGVVVIDRWSIRIVGGRLDANEEIRPVIRTLTAAGRPIPADRTFYGVEVSGELARATWPDGYSWMGSLGTLHLHAVDANGFPKPGTRVRLMDTDYEAIADSAGDIELPDLVPGPYSVTLVDPALSALGVAVPTPLEFTAARRWAILTRLPVRDASEYVAERCRTGGDDGSGQRSQAILGTAWLVGRVVTADGQPVDNAKWTLRYHDLLGDHRTVKNADVDAQGVFQYCELHPGDNVYIDVRAKGMMDASTTAILNKQPTIVTVVMKPR